jgi:Na+/H+ antiporter NhaD/arsenite permease-like protein
MNISLVVLALVLAVVAAGGIGPWRVRIWQAMAGGALAVLITGEIAPAEAAAAVDLDVMAFLFGMFVLGEALVHSGYLYAVAYRLISPVRSTGGLALVVLFASGLASALLMNDTLAVVGTPLMLQLAREHRIDPGVLLLTLAFGVTTGSVLSPIGNPQNLLIAIRTGMESPFSSFLGVLGPPTLVNLLIAWGWLRWRFRAEFHDVALEHTAVGVGDRRLARLARWGVLAVVGMIGLRLAAVGTDWGEQIRLSYIALAGALPVLLGSRQRRRLLRGVDWETLVFFVALFVLMASVWQSGALQNAATAFGGDLATVPAVLGIGLLLSQLISNVPLVALYLPILEQADVGIGTLLALAAGSTIAGNLLILGAASNVIIVQRAARHGAHLGFGTFASAGIPLALIQVGIYWAYLTWTFG